MCVSLCKLLFSEQMLFPLRRCILPLLDTGCDLNTANYDGLTAIQIAVTLRHYELVKLLLKSGRARQPADEQGVFERWQNPTAL